MPKVKAPAKAYTSAIHEQEVDMHSSHEESASLTMSQTVKYHFTQAGHKQPIQLGNKCLCNI